MKNNILEKIEQLVKRNHQEEDLAIRRTEISRTILRNAKILHEIDDQGNRLISAYGGSRDFGFSNPVWIGTSIVGPGIGLVDNYKRGDGIHSDDPVWEKLCSVSASIGLLDILSIFGKTSKARPMAYNMQSRMRNRTMTGDEYDYILNNPLRRVKRYLAKMYDKEH